MKKDVRVFLGHILESVEIAEEYARSISKDEFM